MKAFDELMKIRGLDAPGESIRVEGEDPVEAGAVVQPNLSAVALISATRLAGAGCVLKNVGVPPA